jgi:mono/diheme cytochrome c family protein
MQNYRVIATLGVGLLFSLLASLAVTGQTSQSSSQGGAKPPEFVLPQKHESRLTPAEQRGQAVYEYYCYLCHGKTGKADGFNSYSLTTPPAKFVGCPDQDCYQGGRPRVRPASADADMGRSLNG